MPKARHPLLLESFLPYRLSILAANISDTIAVAYRQQFRLSMSEWHVMAVLARWKDLSAVAVGQRSAMDKVTVSRAIARLVERALVHRAVNRNDKRCVKLNLTEAGWKIHDVIAPLARRQEEALLSRLSPEEIQSLWAILDKLSPADTQDD